MTLFHQNSSYLTFQENLILVKQIQELYQKKFILFQLSERHWFDY
jgi:hypothetical protein